MYVVGTHLRARAAKAVCVTVLVSRCEVYVVGVFIYTFYSASRAPFYCRCELLCIDLLYSQYGNDYSNFKFASWLSR